MAKKLETNFLAVENYLFQLKLNPTEILTLAKILEFQRNTGDCFISNNKLASDFGVSTKTISRTMEALENRGFITRETKNVKGGKERHIKVNTYNIQQALTTDKTSLVNNNDDEIPQRTKRPLTTDKTSLVNGQNDSIKENIKDNLKDNSMEEMKHPTDVIISSSNQPEVEEVSKPEAEVIEITMDDFKKEYENDLMLANTNQLQTKGIIIIFGKTYKIVA